VNALRAKRDEDFAALEERHAGRRWKARRGQTTSPPRATTWERMRELMEESPQRRPATTTG
jgi:hypothetical protein